MTGSRNRSRRLVRVVVVVGGLVGAALVVRAILFRTNARPDGHRTVG